MIVDEKTNPTLVGVLSIVAIVVGLCLIGILITMLVIWSKF